MKKIKIKIKLERNKSQKVEKVGFQPWTSPSYLLKLKPLQILISHSLKIKWNKETYNVVKESDNNVLKTRLGIKPVRPLGHYFISRTIGSLVEPHH